MGISESIFNRTIECCEKIFEDVECEIDSSCCKTHVSNSPKRHHSKDSNNSDNHSNISDK